MLPVIIHEEEKFRVAHSAPTLFNASRRLSALWVLDGDFLVPGDNAQITRARVMELGDRVQEYLTELRGSFYKDTRMVPWVTPENDGFRLRALLVLLPSGGDIAYDREELALRDAASAEKWKELTEAPLFCYSQAGDDDWDINAIAKACCDYSDPADKGRALAPMPSDMAVAMGKIEARLLQVVLEQSTLSAPLTQRQSPRL